MQQPIKYRLGNQPEEYELSTEFLGWIPVGFDDWKGQFDRWWQQEGGWFPCEITLRNKDDGSMVDLICHQYLMKEAFPLSFYGEDRAKQWWNFAMVSKKEAPGEVFVIPMH